MGISINNDAGSCNGRYCKTTLRDGDEVYCEACYSSKDTEVDDLRDKIKELEAEIKSLEEKLEARED